MQLSDEAVRLLSLGDEHDVPDEELLDASDEIPLMEDNAFFESKEPLTDDQRNPARKYLDERRDILDLFYAGGLMAGCDYSIDWTRDQGVKDLDVMLGKGRSGVEDSSSIQKGVRDGVRLLCLEAIVLSDAGENAQAQKAIEQAVRLVQSLHCLPMLMTNLVVYACTNIILKVVEYLVSVYPVSKDQRATLKKGLQSLADQDQLRRTYIGERCFVLTSGLTSGGQSRKERVPFEWNPHVGPCIVLIYDIAGITRADVLWSLRTMESLIEGAGLAPDLRHATLDAICAEIENPPYFRPLRGEWIHMWSGQHRMEADSIGRLARVQDMLRA